MRLTGVITKGIGGFYYVSTERGIVECRARGKMRKQKITPMVGDKVEITIVNEDPFEGALEEISPRTTYLIRPAVANVDTVVIVIAATSPNPDFFMIDKLIVTAEKSDIDVIIAVNKTDLLNPDKIIEMYSSAGYRVTPICASTGEGIEELKKLIQGKITAFAGNSGVGKSSILNCLGFTLETGVVSKIERGKHTTRHIELMPLNGGGFVMDTPVFSLLEITNVKANELKNLFNEFEIYNNNCRFDDCVHIGGKPKDCAVLSAVEQGLIGDSRYKNYTALYDTLKDIKEWS